MFIELYTYYLYAVHVCYTPIKVSEREKMDKYELLIEDIQGNDYTCIYIVRY